MRTALAVGAMLAVMNLGAAEAVPVHVDNRNAVEFVIQSGAIRLLRWRAAA